MCTYYFILSWTGLLCTGDYWAHEEGWVSADPLWQWWCWTGSHQHLSACWMYSVHHCWYSGETGLHQKAFSTGTWMVCEETVNLGYTCHHSAKACSKTVRTFAIKTLLLILQHFKHCPLQSSPLYWQYTIPNISFIVGMLPGTHFLWWRAVLLSRFPESPL